MTKKSLGKLYIRKRSFSGWLACYIFAFPLLMSTLLDLFHLPSILKYTVDIVWLLGAFSIAVLNRQLLFRKKAMPFILFAVGYFLLLAIVYLFNYQSLIYFLWGFRNNFRFYVAFVMFVLFFDEIDASRYLKLLDYVFWINALVTFVQFFLLGYQQDYLGGIFGVGRGCNAYSAVFFSIVLAKSVLSFMNGEEGSFSCFSKCAVALLIAAMAELKFFLVIFFVILIIAAAITKFSARKLVLLIIAAMLIMISGTLLTAIFGESNSITWERIIELATSKSYATAEDLGRFTAIPTLSRNFLPDATDKIFGMGLGNCDTSTFEICNTPFFRTYSYLHYSWFSSAFLFIETGYLGLTVFLSFFVLCFVLARKYYKNNESKPVFCQISMIMSVICVFLTVYNSSLRMEIAYLAYFALALPFMSRFEK